MTRFSRWCFKHRRSVLAGWLLAVVVVLGLSGAVGTKFNSNFNLPGTDSAAAVSLLKANFPTASGEGDQIVIQTSHGATVQSPSVKSGRDRRFGQSPQSPRDRSGTEPLHQGGRSPDSPGQDGGLCHGDVGQGRSQRDQC